MKSNKKLFSAVCVMLLVSVIGLVLVSGTYAKYTTSATGSDTARVARWGFNSVSLTSIDLFDMTYAADDTETPGTDNTVVSTVNVIAPGTTKSATLTFTPESSAAPEVDYSFDVDVTLDNGTDNGTVDADLLTKLEFALDGTEGSETWLSFTDFQTAVQALSADYVEAGSLPNSETSATHTIAWRWVFENGTGETLVANDGTDTDLGNAETLANVRLTFSVGATQID